MADPKWGIDIKKILTVETIETFPNTCIERALSPACKMDGNRDFRAPPAQRGENTHFKPAFWARTIFILP